MRQVICDICGRRIMEEVTKVTIKKEYKGDMVDIDIYFRTSLTVGMHDVPADVCFSCQSELLRPFVEQK